MLRSAFIGFTCLLSSLSLFSQVNTAGNPDSVLQKQLDELIVISERTPSQSSTKPLSNIESYLSQSEVINMLRRGSYAWEPVLNGMGSERSVITIDGMRIYGACTDKMDPVTSYVEITNLASAGVHSGQQGASGSTIAGSIDLKRKKGQFGEKAQYGSLFGGFESNNLQKIVGATHAYSNQRFFSDLNVTFRDAENYRAGRGKEVLNSQYTKYNASATAGYKLGLNQHLEASVIYDRAADIGYPALPMDVSLATALIASLEYVQTELAPSLKQFRTKLYYNNVRHIMDDSQRPEVPIRMDMPGWSNTAGFYSSLDGAKAKHTWKATVSGHRNSSLAEMTMFSNNPVEKDMFMLTWPGVLTHYADFSLEDNIRFSGCWMALFSAGTALHNNVIDNEFGLSSLKIFNPDIEQSKTRVLKRFSASAQYGHNSWQYTLGIGYGERAPAISEAYGFYLFNAFDRFDYIGNSQLKNESSASLISGVTYRAKSLTAKVSANHFYIRDYIIGTPVDLSPMTIGAAGVKVYEQIKYAHVFNSALDLSYGIRNFLLKTRFSYRRGSGDSISSLPLIQPLVYNTGIEYSKGTIAATVSVEGAASQNRYNPEFGELPLPAYSVLNVSVSKRFVFGRQVLNLRSGCENLLDARYTTFSDWNRIPRMGRNLYLNLVYSF